MSLPKPDSQASQTSSCTPMQAIGSLAHASIMMIDDEPIIVDVVKAFLTDSGFKEFFSINDPTYAMDAIRVQRPDVILLDLMMPKVSGFEILRMIRQDPYLKMTPVVVMTGASDAKTKLKVLELGATDFLEKPVDPSELSLRVRNTLAFKAFNDRLAYFDPLTGLGNRSLLLHQVASQVRRNARKKKSFSLLHINLDRFNAINESLGHRNADQLLVSVGQRVQACIRGTDDLSRPAEPSGGNTLARMGGDEFCAVLTDIAEGQLAGRAAKRIQDAIARPFHIDGKELFMTSSMGIATFPTDGQTAEVLLLNAEAAMRESKRAGTRHIRYFNSSFNRESAERLALESQLHRAIERNELRLFYQPKVDLRTLQIVGAEALIRWQHPERGLVPPGMFIPIAEQSNLIIEIGAWALNEACSQINQWKKSGVREIKVAVNVATPQLAENRLAKDIMNSLAKYSVKPNQLIIEFTESILMQNSSDIDAAVQAVARTGVSISLDDFGTGFSSLAYLKRLPLTELKIDRSFVKGLPSDNDSYAIVGAVIALARNLGLQVVAEGVETEGQLAALQRMGCNQFQGFLRSKPIEPEAFITLLN